MPDTENKDKEPKVVFLVRTAPNGKPKSKEGLSPKGDAWLHPEVFDEDYEKSTNRAIRAMKEVEKSMFYVDLEKADMPSSGRRLHREKLVRRPVQVKGKNGRVFTRMQWVDPHTGMPATPKPSHQDEEHWEPQSHPLYNKHATRPTSDKHPDDMNREEFIDHHVRKVLSRDQQYEMINKHGIQWKKNPHPAIDHKNAVVALKNFISKNPHLIGAEHKPTESEAKAKSPSGTDSPNEFWNMWEKDKTGSYDLMRRLGVIGENEPDPREGIDPKDTRAMQLAGMKHMRFVMLLKAHLKDNPSLMRDPRYLPDNNAGKEEAKKIEREDKGIKPTVAQKGGNDINGILNSLPSGRLYELMKTAGITDSDPRLDPQRTPQMAALAHHRNMMLLKKHIEKNPEILRKDEKGQLSREEVERIASLPEKEKDKERIGAFVRDMSPESIEDAYNYLTDEFPDDADDYGTDKMNNKHEGIRNMHRKTFIGQMFEKHPELMEEYEQNVENKRLMEMKIGNKTMRAILTSIGGLKAIGDVTRPEDGDEESRRIEWTFHGGDSSARFEINHEGTPVLSVIDSGDPDVWNEFEIPLKQVKEWLDNRKKDKDTSFTKKEKPLHLRPIDQIGQALEDDFDKNYTPEIEPIMKKHLSRAWKGANKSGVVAELAKRLNNMTVPTVKKLLHAWGVPVDESSVMSRFNSRSDQWKKIGYADDIETTKGKNAWDYMNMGDTDVSGTVIKDPYVLIESAKHWTPQERHSARSELLEKAIDIPGSMHREDHKHRMRSLQQHFLKGMSHIPFDMLSHLHAGNLKLSITDTRNDGKPHFGNHFDPVTNSCVFDPAYYNDKSVFEDHPLKHRPEPSPHPLKPTNKMLHWDFQDNIAHETGHAIDAMLSNNKGGVFWNNKPLVDKLIPSGYENLIPDSYRHKVESTNPDYKIGFGKSGLDNYPYVRDQWLTNYEGRLYGNMYSTLDPSVVTRDNGQVHDKSFLNTQGIGAHGSEHWTESLTAYANAKHGYELWKQVNPNKVADMPTVDDWAKKVSRHFQNQHYGMDYERETDPSLNAWNGAKRNSNILFSGWKYHALKEQSPKMFEGLQKIFDRGDFLGHKE